MRFKALFHPLPMHPVLKLAARAKPYWKRSLVALIFLTGNVFIDLSIPRLIQRIIDQGIAGQNQQVVLATALIMLALSALSALIAVGNNIFSVQVGERLARDLRDELFAKIQRFSFANLDRHPTGHLLVLLSSDTGAVQRLVQVFLRIGTRAPMLMVGSLLLMINTSPQLALQVSPLLLITAIVIAFFVFKMEPLFDLVQQKLDRLNTVLQENIAGVRLVRAFVRADHEGRRFETANKAFTDDSIQVMQFMATMFPALTLCVNIGVVVVIYAGGLRAVEGDLSIGQIVAFTNYLLTTMGPLALMGMLANVWARGAVSARRIGEILETVPAVKDRPDAQTLPEPVRGHLVFDHVSFHYASDESVLNDIDLTIEPGQTLAILGATGAGKSTLVNLVPRFYDATAGRITLDGIDLRCISRHNLLEHIAIVPQETILFSGSVRDNIRYGRPGAGEEEVERAAKDAQAHHFILKLPHGYDTHVEQRGVNLSGGQKQRLAIARALLVGPKVLILDDSTSAVDVETETRIQDALESYAHTRIVVAQRISTVLNADKIAVLDKGCVAAEGTHAELMQTSGIYREIYASQLGHGIDAETSGKTGSMPP